LVDGIRIDVIKFTCPVVIGEVVVVNAITTNKSNNYVIRDQLEGRRGADESGVRIREILHVVISYPHFSSHHSF